MVHKYLKNNIFSQPKDKTLIKDTEKIKKLYSVLQPTIFIVMYIMYFTSYLGRKSLCVGFNGSAVASAMLDLPDNM